MSFLSDLAKFGVPKIPAGSQVVVSTAVADETPKWKTAICQYGADGNLYVIFGTRTDGSFFGPGVAESRDLIHIPLLGQSNMMADQSIPVISTADTGWGSYRFSRGMATWSSTDNAVTPALRAASGFSLVPLTSGIVETRANGLADALKARLSGASRFSPVAQTGAPHVLITSASIGGRKLTELGPEDHGASGEAGARAPGGHWRTMLDDITRAKAAAEASGYLYQLPCWFYDQGESEGDLKLYYNQASADTITNTRTGYKTKALTMVATFDSAVRALVGQSRPIPLLVTPACSNLITSSAWMDASDESDLVKIVGPRYMTRSALNCAQGTGGAQTWGDKIHHDPDAHRWIGEQCAKVAHRLLFDGEEWKPMRALKALKVDGTHVDVVFHVPRLPMVIDTELIAKMSGWGFSMWSGSLDAPSARQYATGVELLADGRTVRLTFATAVPAGAKLSLGLTSVVDLGITPTVAAIGSGANTANGFATHTIAFTGDIRTALLPVSQEGAFFVRATAKATECVIRSVAFDGTSTVLTGEVREIRSDGAFVPVAAGDAVNFGRQFGGLNLRDSDSAASINTFVAGPRIGQPYPLHNWACQYDGLSVVGA